jgi:hypothetical protein
MNPQDEHDFLLSVGGRVLPREVVRGLYGADAAQEPHWDFGYIPPERRTPEQTAVVRTLAATLPELQIRGSWQDQQRVELWRPYKTTHGKFLPYNWQLTGSCVGAGGGNMAKTLMSVQEALGLMEYRELFWLFTYGKSRQRSGMRGRGEGSTGEGYGEAATADGYVAFDEDPSLGQPNYKDGWLQFPESAEYKWSDGAAAPAKEVEIGKLHLIKAKAVVRDSAAGVAALTNGYPMTQCSNFGFKPMVPQPRGNPPRRIVKWNGNWSHQTYIDSYEMHPEFKLIFRWGNNWGPEAHGKALEDEPDSTVWIEMATFDQIARSGTILAFSPDIGGFPARDPRPWSYV